MIKDKHIMPISKILQKVKAGYNIKTLTLPPPKKRKKENLKQNNK